MAPTVLPDQPQPSPSYAEIFRRVEDLPFFLPELARALLTPPGVDAHFLSRTAERFDAAVKELRDYGRNLTQAEADGLTELASVLRDAMPLFPHPPRLPLSAEEADRAIRRRLSAAGIATASGVPGR